MFLDKFWSLFYRMSRERKLTVEINRALEKHALVKAARQFSMCAHYHSGPRVNHYDPMKGDGHIVMVDGAADWDVLELDGFELWNYVSWWSKGIKPEGYELVFINPSNDNNNPEYLFVRVSIDSRPRGQHFEFYMRLYEDGTMAYRTEMSGDPLPATAAFIELVGIEPSTFNRDQHHGPETYDPAITALAPSMSSTERPFSDEQAARLAEYLITQTGRSVDRSDASAG